MRKSLIVIATAIGLVLAAVAGAHVFVSSPQLSIAKVPSGSIAPGARIIVYGRIHSSRSFCKRDRRVRLFRVSPGPDRFLGSDRTDNEGEYRFVRRPRRDQTVYTRIGRLVVSSYGHRHACRADRSRNLRINVR